MALTPFIFDGNSAVMKHFTIIIPRRWAYGLCLILLITLASCATGPKMADHAFSFDGWSDGWAKQVDLLEYDYGDQYRMVRRKAGPSDDTLGYQAGVNGPMPVGDFLYVKWRIKATGEVCEDRVDLRPLLPKDMTNYRVTFVIDGKQLYVYLVTPTPKHEEDPPILKTFESWFHVTYEIYPHNTFPSTLSESLS
jgi:hypothetical protein